MSEGSETVLADYQDALARFLMSDDALVREHALNEATEIGKTFVAVAGPTIDDLRELHQRALQLLVEIWRQANEGSAERVALDRITRGEASAVGIAFMLPQELEQMRLHEQRWRREHGKLIALFDQTDDLILTLDERGQIESVNPAFSRRTGWSALQAVALVASMWNGPLPTSETRRMRNKVTQRNGDCFLAEWSISPIFDQDGVLLSHVCIGRDITREQQIEDSLRENVKLRAVATLAGGIAHDFNNLLGSILGLSELCELDAVAGSTQARNLRNIRQASDKAAALVRQMLDFSRQTPMTPQCMTVAEWLRHCDGLLRAALPRHLALDVTVSDDAPVRIDLVQMEQVLLNMVRNAAQALTSGTGQLRIVADRAVPAVDPSRAGQVHARIRVIDTGMGIAPDLLSKIFEPFFTTKPVGEGTGLGLSAAHGIIANHGGVIQVASTLGQGSCFSIFLPLAVAVVNGCERGSGGT